MLYQVKSMSPLMTSKKYCKDLYEIKLHLKAVETKTNEYRKKVNKDVPGDKISKLMVSQSELMEGICILNVDTEKLLNWEKLLGTEKPISPPIEYK